jgi:hypothetical protein
MMNFLFKTLEILSYIATLTALGIGIYAFLNPATVSEFLKEISENTEVASRSLEDIGANTQETANSASGILQRLPYWIETKMVSRNKNSGIFEISLENSSTFVFREVDVSIVARGRGVVYRQDGFVIPPRESVSLEDSEHLNRGYLIPEYYCLSAVHSDDGTRYYESRGLIYGDVSDQFRFSSYEFSDRPIEVCQSR